MPNASDLLDRGIDEGFLKNIGAAMESQGALDDEAKIGIKAKGWEYEHAAVRGDDEGARRL